MDLTRDRMVRFVGKAWDQVKSPLYRNAFYLMLAYLVGQALGLAFWVIAYRFYDTNDAGFAIAMVNTLTFLAGVATLGMPVALIRFLPESDNPTALVNSVMSVSGAIVFVLSLVFIVGLPIWAPGLVVQFWRPEYVPIVVLTAMAYTFGPILDQAAIAARRADLYFWRIVIFSVTKIPLPVVFALWLGDALNRIRVLGIYMSWSIAFGVSVLVAAFVFLPRVIQGYRPRPRLSRKRLRPIFAFSIGNWTAGVIGSAGSLLLPLVIINTLRTEIIGGVDISPSSSTAVYYAATVVAGSLSAIPAATMTSFYAEASQRNASRRRDERRAIVLSLALLVPGIVALWFLAGPLLRILFDLRPELADLGTPVLQILGLASIPVFLNAIFGTRVRIRKQVTPLIVSAAILTAATLVLGYLFLTWYRLPGLAWAVVIGNAAATPYLFLAAGKPIEEEAIEPPRIVP
jgi:O-antigen/teichoic acid export membrane protein